MSIGECSTCNVRNNLTRDLPGFSSREKCQVVVHNKNGPNQPENIKQRTEPIQQRQGHWIVNNSRRSNINTNPFSSIETHPDARPCYQPPYSSAARKDLYRTHPDSETAPLLLSKRRMLNDRSGFTVSQPCCDVPQSMPGPDQLERSEWQRFEPTSQLSDVDSSTNRHLSQSPSFLPSPATDSRGFNSIESDLIIPQPNCPSSGISQAASSSASSQPAKNGPRSHQPPEKPLLYHQPQTQHQNIPPGKVLFLRNLPQNVVESDVQSFVSPFIRTSTPNIYLQFATGQAFVEFGSPQEAQEACKFFRAHPTTLGGNIIQVCFSERKCVTTNEDINADFRVLLATVTNLMYPVDIELLRFLFSRFGNVQKALIQMEEASQAKLALTTLHSRNIYDACNTLQIQPSRLSELTVKMNNAKAWDYTIAPEGVPHSIILDDQVQHSALRVLGNNCDTSPLRGICKDCRNRFNSPGFIKIFSLPRLPREVREWKHSLQTLTTVPTPLLIAYNLTVDEVTVNELFNVFSLYGILQRVKILRDKPHTALLQYSDTAFASLATYFLQGAALFDTEMGIQINFSKNPEIKLSNGLTGTIQDKRTRAFQVQDQRYSPSEIDKFVRSACPPTRTLFIANLREHCAEEQVIEEISKYGHVVKYRVKLPPDGPRRKYMLVEMNSACEALKALAKLHNATLGESSLKVSFSKLLISEESNTWCNSSTINAKDGSHPLISVSTTDCSNTTTSTSK